MQALERVVFVVASTLWYVLPAWIANATPVVFGGGKPLDMGLKVRGKRLFGDNKTIKGTLSGLIAGFLIGVAQLEPLRGALLTVGAVPGDLLGSFTKRQLGLKPGDPAPLLDQLDFILGALLFASVYAPPPKCVFITAILLTLVAHLLSNLGAYALGLKSKPW